MLKDKLISAKKELKDNFTKDKERKRAIKSLSELQSQLKGLRSFLEHVIKKETVVLQEDEDSNLDISIKINICPTCSELIILRPKALANNLNAALADDLKDIRRELGYR